MLLTIIQCRAEAEVLNVSPGDQAWGCQCMIQIKSYWACPKSLDPSYPLNLYMDATGFQNTADSDQGK